VTPETLLKRTICSWLRLKRPDIFFWVSDRVGIYDPVKKTFRRNADPYRIKGVSDILGILPNGLFLAIEVKTKTGRVSIEQKAFLSQIEASQGIAFVARSIEDVEMKLKPLHQTYPNLST
jgi:hypothetical protein